MVQLLTLKREIIMAKETRTFSEVVEDISTVLAETDGEFLAEQAEGILGKKVEYMGDGFFEIEE
jgi:hypothetical protein